MNTLKNQTAKTRGHKGAFNPLVSMLVGVMALAAVGVTPRVQNQLELNKVHQELQVSVPHVSAVVAKAAAKTASLTLPGDLQPIQNIPIYARANGYLLKRFVDIGDNVKAGDLLAIIDTPELDQQVQTAAANLRGAQSAVTSAISDRENYSAQLFAAESTIKQTTTNLAYSTIEFKRYHALANAGAVSIEQRDQALRQYNSDTAALEVAKRNAQALRAAVAAADARIGTAKETVEANQATLSQLKATQGFQKVVAPADGVITNRFADAGALIAAGGATGTTQLLSMARTDTLRIYVDVPQSDYRQIHDHDQAEVTLQEFPGQKFVGTVTNIAGSLNSDTRTLQTEIRIDNHSHVLKPGSYAEVSFHYSNPNPPVVIPSSATITKNDGLYAAVVTNGKIQFRHLEVARDYGSKMEISQGLKANDVVVLDAPDSLTNGTVVKAQISTSL